MNYINCHKFNLLSCSRYFSYLHKSVYCVAFIYTHLFYFLYLLSLLFLNLQFIYIDGTENNESVLYFICFLKHFSSGYFLIYCNSFDLCTCFDFEYFMYEFVGCLYVVGVFLAGDPVLFNCLHQSESLNLYMMPTLFGNCNVLVLVPCSFFVGFSVFALSIGD